MTIFELRQLIDSSLRGNQLVLQAGGLPPGGVADFIRQLPQSALSLANPSVSQASPLEVQVTGTLETSWDVPGFDGAQLTEVSISLVCVALEPSADAIVSLVVNQGRLGIFDGMFFQVSGMLDQRGRLALSLSPGPDGAPQPPLPGVLNRFAGALWEGRSGGILPAGVAGMFGMAAQVLLSGVDLWFSPTAAAPSQVMLAMQLSTDIRFEFGQFRLALTGISLGMMVERAATAGNGDVMAFGSVLDATAVINEHQIQAIVECASDDLWNVSFLLDDGNVLAALDKLASLVGGEKLVDEVQQGLTDMQCSSAQLRTVSTGFDLSGRALTQLSFTADATVGGIDVGIHGALYPSLQLGIGFPADAYAAPAGQGIDLNAWLGKVYGPLGGFLPATEIAALSVFVGRDAGEFDFDIELDVTGDWQLSVDSETLTVTEVSMSLDRMAGQWGVALHGRAQIAKVDFMLTATHSNGDWQLSGQAVIGATKPVILAHFFVRFLTWLGVTVPSDVHTPQIEMGFLDITYDTASKTFTFNGLSAGTVDFPLINGATLTLDLQAQLTSTIDAVTEKRVLGGDLLALTTIKGELFDFSYQLGQDTSIVTCTWAGGKTTLSVSDILGAFGFDDSGVLPFEIPSWLDNQLVLSAVTLQVNLLLDELSVVATVADGAQMFLQIGKVTGGAIDNGANGSYTAVLGLALSVGKGFGALPVVPPDFAAPLALLDFLHLEFGCILLASGAVPAFLPPTIPNVPNGFATLGASARSLPQGLSLAFEIDFANTGNPIANNMAAVMPSSTVMCQMALTPDAPMLELQGSLNGLSISLGEAGAGLQINDAQVCVKIMPKNRQDPLAFQISGSAQVPIGKKTLYAKVSLGFDETEANASFMLREALSDSDKPVALLHPMGLKGIALDDIGGSIGATFEPPSVVMSLMGGFSIGGQPYGSNQFAFAVAFEEEVPDPVFLHAHLAELDMSVILEACFDDGVGTPAFMDALSLSEVSIYWCQTSVMLPNGTMTQPGFGFNGTLELLDFGLYASVSIMQAQGMSGSAQMSPVTSLPGLKIGGNGPGVTVRQMYIDGQWQTVTQALLDSAPAGTPTRQHQAVRPGGPCLQLSTMASPYFAAGLDVSLLGLKASVDADVSNAGFQFALSYPLDGGTLSLTCTLPDTGHFSGSSSYTFGLEHDFGPYNVLGIFPFTFHVDSTFQASLALTIDTQFALTVNGTFDFEGVSMTMPELTLDINFTDMKNLPGAIINQIENNLETVFADVIKEMENLLQQGLKEAEKIAAAAAAEVIVIADDARKEAADIAAKARQLADEIGRQTAATAAALIAGIQTLETQTLVAVTGIVDDMTQQVQKLGNEAAAILQLGPVDAARIARDAEAIVRGIEDQAEQVIQETEREIEAGVAAAQNAAQQILDTADTVANGIEQGAQQAITAIESAATDIWNQVDSIEQELEKIATSVVDAVGNVISDAWDSIEDTFSC